MAGPEEVQAEMEYFRVDAERMRYAKFRSQGLFVGSGVVEAGCKIFFGQRLKLSGQALDNQGCQRHYRAEMLSTERALGSVLGVPCYWLISPIHKFVAHPASFPSLRLRERE